MTISRLPSHSRTSGTESTSGRNKGLQRQTVNRETGRSQDAKAQAKVTIDNSLMMGYPSLEKKRKISTASPRKPMRAQIVAANKQVTLKARSTTTTFDKSGPSTQDRSKRNSSPAAADHRNFGGSSVFPSDSISSKLPSNQESSSVKPQDLAKSRKAPMNAPRPRLGIKKPVPTASNLVPRETIGLAPSISVAPQATVPKAKTLRGIPQPRLMGKKPLTTTSNATPVDSVSTKPVIKMLHGHQALSSADRSDQALVMGALLGRGSVQGKK